jgi:anti-sigma B factor antagonist
MFHIQQREMEGIFILDLDGRLALGEATSEFNDTVSELIGSGKTSLVLNLQKVPMIDSSGLGSMVAAQTSAKSGGGAVKLLHVSERHIELLVLTRLTTEFEMFNDEQAAIDSFFPDRKRTAFDILEFVQEHGSDSQPLGEVEDDSEAPKT